MYRTLWCAALLQGLLFLGISALEDCNLDVQVMSTIPPKKALPGDDDPFVPTNSEEFIEFKLLGIAVISGVTADTEKPYDIECSIVDGIWNSFGGKIEGSQKGAYSLTLEVCSSLRIRPQAAISNVRFTRCPGMK